MQHSFALRVLTGHCPLPTSASGGGKKHEITAQLTIINQYGMLLTLDKYQQLIKKGDLTMNQIEVQAVDLGIMAAYLVLMAVIGITVMKRVKNAGDYFIGGRSFGTLVLLTTVCATLAGGGGLMGRAGVAYSSGFKAVMTAIPYLIGMFLFSAIAGKISALGFQHNITSIPDLFERRFGKLSKIILGILITFAMIGTLAAQVTATATILRLVLAKYNLSYTLCAIISCLVFVVYTATSGMFGVVYTDLVQFFVLILFAYIMIPAGALIKVGGFGAFFSALDSAHTTPVINGSILGDIVTYLVFTLAAAEMWQRAFAAKDRKSATAGTAMGTGAYALMIVIVYAIGLLGWQILGPNVAEEYGSLDAVVPLLAIRVLPSGLVGLALAGMLATIMSTADSYLLVSVQSCVHDVGKTLWPEVFGKYELRLGRIFTLLLAVAALLLALCFKNAYNVIVFSWGFYAAAAGLPAFAALVWKKATTPGILAGMLGGLVVSIGWKIAGEPFGLGSTVPGTIVCGILLVTVSLLTYRKHPSIFLEVKKR